MYWRNYLKDVEHGTLLPFITLTVLHPRGDAFLLFKAIFERMDFILQFRIRFLELSAIAKQLEHALVVGLRLRRAEHGQLGDIDLGK